MDRITKWLAPKEITSIIVSLDNNHVKYEIQKNNGRYAVFTEKTKSPKRKVIDLMLLLGRKREGISILKTLGQIF